MVLALLLLVLLFEDCMNGWVTATRIISDMQTGQTYFSDSCCRSFFPVGKSEWQYDVIVQATETKDYFVLFLCKTMPRFTQKLVCKWAT